MSNMQIAYRHDRQNISSDNFVRINERVNHDVESCDFQFF